ncbi:MAG: hypothetical protein GWN61_26860, partial [candidate division Zixibacteria bacterium]|nr:glycosyltransferase family 4 protein [candidate division Zixibacteria bacterium]NIV09692.1 hypothetical protein [candidate division Zixibacteria bacterium]
KTLVNTKEYVSILKKRGYRQDGIGIFKRGIDTDLFSPAKDAKTILQKRYSLDDGVYTLFAGRVSRDKGVDIAVKAFIEASQNPNNSNHYMLIAGHGPLEDELTAACRKNKNII